MRHARSPERTARMAVPPSAPTVPNRRPDIAAQRAVGAWLGRGAYLLAFLVIAGLLLGIAATYVLDLRGGS